MKQVKSFRGAYSETSLHTERLWEVDCNRVIVHQDSTNGDSTFSMREDEFLIGEQRYTHSEDGAWENTGYAGDRGSAKWYCDNIARGTVSDLLPDIRTMIRHAMTERGSKKTINGVSCREWKFDMRTALSDQRGSVCLGVDDHLPYELTMEGGHYSYSDYNRPIQFDVPEAVLQTASAATPAN